MGKRIELCEGSWAEVFDGRLRGKHRAELQSYIGRATTIENGKVDQTQFGSVMAGAAEFTLSMLIESWHLSYAPQAEVPFRNPDWLEAIDVDDLGVLIEATAPQFDKLMLRRNGREPDTIDASGRPDPSGPTPPAVGPGTPSEAETSPRHSVTSSDGGTEPSSTSASSSAGV